MREGKVNILIDYGEADHKQKAPHVMACINFHTHLKILVYLISNIDQHLPPSLKKKRIKGDETAGKSITVTRINEKTEKENRLDK